MRIFALPTVLACTLLTVGCGGGLLPASGPNAVTIKGQSTTNGPRYGLVQLSPGVVNILEQYGPRSFTATFGDRRPPPKIRFGIGDVVSVSIYESAAGGLFIPSEAGVRPGNFVTLQNQPVDDEGMITVPYAGAIPAAGKTPREVQNEIVERIHKRAIDPQAMVSLVAQNTSLITVIGEVNSQFQPTGRVPAQPAGERLLDVISRAGGLRDQGQDTWVVLERRGRRAAAPFGALIDHPQDNIWAWPDDTIYLYKEPQTFLAFGAAGQQGEFQFSAGNQSSAWKMTLAEAIAAAGGLLDLQADPGSVFLYRREPRELALKLGVDCSKMDGPTIPIIYSVTFADPAGYFLATKMQMHNKDVIFAANAQSVEITKLTTFLNTLISTGNNAIATGVGAQTLRVLSQTSGH
jgi:polysaccharide biosynthesis/export protein